METRRSKRRFQEFRNSRESRKSRKKQDATNTEVKSFTLVHTTENNGSVWVVEDKFGLIHRVPKKQAEEVIRKQKPSVRYTIGKVGRWNKGRTQRLTQWKGFPKKWHWLDRDDVETDSEEQDEDPGDPFIHDGMYRCKETGCGDPATRGFKSANYPTKCLEHAQEQMVRMEATLGKEKVQKITPPGWILSLQVRSEEPAAEPSYHKRLRRNWDFGSG